MIPAELCAGEERTFASSKLDDVALAVSEICGNSDRRTTLTLMAEPRKLSSA